ncbi:hypothetical protein [Sphingomonas colocasiae]|uniref:Glycosyl transferase n=1 Tax=Sphingomonas colocasiae TaxID=1848973 RepID=A0ABS7PUA8_9SPHN|nr:hypothetical protein [Sphingomonas colocasiae]MBY8824936.1 hypothetical protein [Sphingomonas colocasiae]
MRIGFLFNHEAAHQVAHSLPVALSLARRCPDIDVRILPASGAAEDEIRRLAGETPSNLRVTPLRGAHGAARMLNRASGGSIPIDRISTLYRNRDRFRDLTALVVPEKTSLLLKTHLGLPQLKMIHTRHGAGDRAVGFDRASGRFDLVLLSGPKIRDRLDAAGLLRPNGHAIVGYPKFDLKPPRAKRRLFADDRPVVLYNPHPSPALSSWYRHGPFILDYFSKSSAYNLIFAPHVMLFAKRFNISLSPPAFHAVPGVPRHIFDAPNIHVDPGSAASVDMSYTDAADIYLGDASSQVYEFMRTPRPCIFFDAHRQRWRDDPNFAHWAAGPVVNDMAALDAALADAVARPHGFETIQKRLFAYSFDLADTPSADRAAAAIAAFLGA